ncbi:MAG: hypothetical protein DMF97_12115 [Acidobacteria bacterium]|nr:MAG: hypothetical protein DMF97_12115 [Acidobacteriota bacterium]
MTSVPDSRLTTRLLKLPFKTIFLLALLTFAWNTSHARAQAVYGLDRRHHTRRDGHDYERRSTDLRHGCQQRIGTVREGTAAARRLRGEG